MSAKLTEYNHRFNDLAVVLSNHYDSSLLQDKISALIQPVRGNPSIPNSATASASAAHSSSAVTSKGYTAIVTRAPRVYGQCNTKSLEQRAKILKEDMDLFRDQCKLGGNPRPSEDD